MTFPKTHLNLLLELAARIVEVRPTGSSHEVVARDLLGGFADACIAGGQDALVEDFDPEAHETALVAELDKRYEERGPRNAKPRILVDCLLAALGIELVDDPTPAISLDDDVKRDVTAVLTAALDTALSPAQLRDKIIGIARAATDESQRSVFEKIAAQLDDRGLAIVKQPKVPLDASQAIQKHLTAAREQVIGSAASAAIDRAKEIIARADADAAARIDAPVTLKLTPRDVAIRRILGSRVPKTVAVVVPVLVDALAAVARIAWRAPAQTARAYSAKETFVVGEYIDHPKFGRGKVTSVEIKRIAVEFPDGDRALVHAAK